MNDGGAFLNGIHGIKNRRQLLVLNFDKPHSLLGRLHINGHHGCHCVADVPYLVTSQRVLILPLGNDAVHPIGDVAAGDDALNTGKGKRPANIHLKNAAVGDRGAD